MTARAFTMADARAAAQIESWGLRMLVAREQSGWREHAACRGVNPELFYSPIATDKDKCRALCAHCRVRMSCLAAVQHDEGDGWIDEECVFGIAGGLTPADRIRARRADHTASRVPSHLTAEVAA